MVAGMSAAVLERAGEIRMVQRGVPEPGTGEGPVRIRAVGVCSPTCITTSTGGASAPE